MTTSKDREQLLALNGTAAPHSRDHYNKASSSTWKQEPTPINRPTNPPMIPRMTHQPGSNPFGHNPNQKPKHQKKVGIGNQTSTRILGMSNDPPPRKKVKTEHTPPHATSGGPNTRQWDRSIHSKLSHEVPLALETIDVDDDWDSSMGDNSRTTLCISSSDELNIRGPSTEEAHSSKYSFNPPMHGSAVRSNNPPIAPDGESTEWAKKKFSQGSSDYISNRNFPPSGQVRNQVAKFEAMENPPMIDLKSKIKSIKSRMRTKDHKLFPREQAPREQPSRASQKRNVLPLKEIYVDDQHWDSEGLEISWLPHDQISIKSAKKRIFGPLDIRTNGGSLIYHDDSDPFVPDPVFQLKMMPRTDRHGTDVKCLTIRLDCSNPGPHENCYRDLLDWLKARVNEKENIRAAAREMLWESASRNQRNSGQRRLDELHEGESRRAGRSLIDEQNSPRVAPKRSASQSSLRITPPVHPNTVSVPGNQKLKQRSRIDTSDLPESLLPRRSTRSTAGATRPAIDSDEVILVYPPGVAGAVNITNGDLDRLRPGEFLNDTLIEFGLKLWLKELELTNPLLASQIHVFNSFFYKKLNHHKKGTNSGGYASVRKWTSKFDIFQKKYIIVPINEHLHWYFAIICEPEHVLVPAASNIQNIHSTRQQTRQLISELMVTDEPSVIPTASKPISASVSVNDREENELRIPSEAEVEDTLHDFKGSCSISNFGPCEDEAGVNGGRSPSALSYVSDNVSKDVLRPLSPTASDHERALLRHSPSDETMAMDLVDDLPTNLRTTNHVSEMRSVDAASFYQRAPPKRNKGKRKADPEPEPESCVMEIDDDDVSGSSVLGDTPKTYIFTFDSLGGRHPQAIKKLSAYLKLEAGDKKKVMNPSSAEGKVALVPEQPNFCDCGIYLLHLAQTFMSNPAYYCRMILAQKARAVPKPERQAEWHDHRVTERREELANRIKELSSEWKKDRAAKEEAKQKEALSSHTLEVAESSDCEIDILEPTRSASKAQSGGKRKTGHATRLRG